MNFGALLANLTPIELLDLYSFQFPEKFLRSQLVSGLRLSRLSAGRRKNASLMPEMMN